MRSRAAAIREIEHDAVSEFADRPEDIMTGQWASTAESRSFTLSAPDLLEVQRRIFWSVLRSPRFLMVFALAAAAVLGGRFALKDNPDVIGWAIWLVAFSILFPLVTTLFILPRQTRAALRNEPRYTEPWHVGFEPDGLTVSNAQGVTRYDWKGFTGRQVGPTMLVLMITPKSFVPIPLHALREGDLQMIDARLREAGVKLG